MVAQDAITMAMLSRLRAAIVTAEAGATAAVALAFLRAAGFFFVAMLVPEWRVRLRCNLTLTPSLPGFIPRSWPDHRMNGR